MNILIKGSVLAIGLALGGFLTVPAMAQGGDCGTDRTIDIAEMSWPSAAAAARIHAFVLEHGYGCEVGLLPLETQTALSAMTARGVPAVAPEFWPNASKEAWEKALAEGSVVNLGPAITEGIVQGWYVPTFVVEANPGLRSVEDLPEYAELFEDPEDPSKGRFVSCPPGWACEVMDANFFKAYELGETFNLFSPGSGGALDAMIKRAFLQEKPIVFYYWGPTSMMGEFDMTRLEMAPFDEGKFACIGDPECDNPQKTDFVIPDAVVAVASWLPEEAPAIATYLENAELTNAEIGRMLLWAESESSDAQATAMHFLESEQDIWTSWVPADVAEKVMAAL